MFDEMLVVARRGLVKGLLNYFLLHNFFPDTLMFWKYHSIMGSDLGFGPQKVT